MDKVVLRFSDGRILKGYLEFFSSENEMVFIKDLSGERRSVNVDELKAIFL